MTTSNELESPDIATGFRGGPCEVTITLKGVLTREEADEIMEGLQPHLRLLIDKYKIRQQSVSVANT